MVNYIYNAANPLNDMKVHTRLQKDCEAFVRAMPPYEPLVR